MSDEQEAPVFSIEKIYTRDLSLEVPNAPHCFVERETPDIEVQLHTQGSAVGDALYDVTLTVTVTAKIAERTQFLVEVAQAGLFVIRNVPEDEVEPVIAIACPNILFPYAREVIASSVGRAGFPAIQLDPVNFENIYRQRLAEAQQEAAPTAAPAAIVEQ
jgi:preprotein translocase subunit SecB